jgi:uncharacterized membrane protein YgcG
MKNKIIIAVTVIILLATACLKEKQQTQAPATPTQQTLGLAEVKDWYTRNSNLQGSLSASTDPTPPNQTVQPRSFKLASLAFKWEQAQSVNTARGNYWVIPTNGQPVFGKVKQGYRKLAFIRSAPGQIQPRILEIIPDAFYYMRHTGGIDPQKFNGRIFVYDQDYHLIGGQVYSGGIIAGQISSQLKKQAASPASQTTVPSAALPGPRQLDAYISCDWTDYNYINSEGIFTVYSEQDCTGSISGGGSDTSGMAFSGSAGGGGGGGSSGDGGDGSNAADFDLPDGNNPAADPRKMMDCFSNLPDIGSTMTVTIYVVEPLPGTSFAIGPNSVGHTAIGLTKTYNGTTITQVVGFYPDATGKDKLHAPSKIEDNGGDLPYNVSISYPVIASTFNQIVQYISNPPATYDLTGFNCTNFVYNACQAGGITLPNPYSIISTDGFGGFVQAMTPGGLGTSISNLQGVAPVTGSGITPFSKGPCD